MNLPMRRRELFTGAASVAAMLTVASTPASADAHETSEDGASPGKLTQDKPKLIGRCGMKAKRKRYWKCSTLVSGGEPAQAKSYENSKRLLLLSCKPSTAWRIVWYHGSADGTGGAEHWAR